MEHPIHYNQEKLVDRVCSYGTSPESWKSINNPLSKMQVGDIARAVGSDEFMKHFAQKAKSEGKRRGKRFISHMVSGMLHIWRVE